MPTGTPRSATPSRQDTNDQHPQGHPMGLTYAEFCAGAGGLGMAVEDVFNAELSWYSEFDAAASTVMAHHWPDAPNHGDMTTIDFATVTPVDILSGGTPCQDLSHAGRRAGMRAGTRSGLWESMREAIATIQPTYVVWENVRGAYSAGADSAVEQCPGCMGETRDGEHFLRALGRVLGDLSDLGYDCQWRGLRAADVGAPHGRFRVFILATRAGAAADAHNLGLGQPRAVGPEPERDPAAGRGGTAAYTYRVRGNGSWGRASQDWRRQPPHRGLPAPDAGGAALGEHPTGSPSQETRSGGSDRPGDHRGERPHPHGRQASAHPQGDAGRVQHGDHGSADWGPYAPAIHRWESVHGPAPAATELTDKGKHRLNPRFAEWLMGWPAGWVNLPGISRTDQLKIIGNGVVPQQARAALTDMLLTADVLDEAAA